MSSQRSTINQEGWRERVVNIRKIRLKEERSQILQKNTCFICTHYEWILVSLEVMSDHVHIFLQADPQTVPAEIAKTLKSISAVHLFNKFPKLKSRKFWGSGLWSRETYYATVGHITEASVKKYIEMQKIKN